MISLRFLFTLSTFFFLFQNAFSQLDFRKAYIFTNEGDTISGLINYRESNKNYKICDFKESKDKETIFYDPNQLRGYQILYDKYFESKNIEVDGKTFKKYFLEVLVKGKVSLYRYQRNFFIEKNDAIFYQLVNEKKEIIIDGKRVIKREYEYLGILSALLSDCSGVKEEIVGIKYSKKELVSLIERYNNCMGEPSISYKNSKARFRFRVGASIGLNHSKFKVKSYRTQYLFFNPYPLQFASSKYDPSLSVSPSLILNFSFPKLNERLSFQTNIAYLSATYYSYFVNETTVITRNDVTIDIKQLKTPIGIRYEFSFKKIRPYVIGGISHTFNLNISSEWIKEVENYNNVIKTSSFEDFMEVKPNQLGYWGGLGIVKTITPSLNGFAEFSYEITNGLTNPNNDPRVDSKITNLTFLIGVIF